jgi:hypothetical protein
MIQRSFVVVRREEVQGASFDERLRPIAESFALYLSLLRLGGKGSKYSKMGPVGKILTRFRNGMRGNSVMGDAVRIHEMTMKANDLRVDITPEQLAALEQAVFGLSDLLTDERVSAADYGKIVASVDAMVYYYVEKRRKEFMTRTQAEFLEYLQTKYASVEELKEAWGDEELTWERVGYPSQKRARNDQALADVKAFWQFKKGEQEPEMEWEEEETGV